MDITIAKWFVDLVQKAGPRMLYPVLPFLAVPLLVVGLVGSQMNNNLSGASGTIPAALDLPMSIELGKGVTQESATLVVIPSGDRDFFVESVGRGVGKVWVGVPEEKISINSNRILLAEQGVEVQPLRGVSYPLAIVLEGEHGNSTEPVAGSPQSFEHLELSTSESTWMILSLLGSAIFGFGVSIGFIKDLSIA